MVPDQQLQDLNFMGNEKELHPSAAAIGRCDICPTFIMDNRSEDQDPLPNVLIEIFFLNTAKWFCPLDFGLKLANSKSMLMQGKITTADDGALVQPSDAECNSIQVDSLRFEVNKLYVIVDSGLYCIKQNSSCFLTLRNR